ncbi:MAG: serine/threonine-protein kinase, partial [Planctomycetota bacterium]
MAALEADPDTLIGYFGGNHPTPDSKDDAAVLAGALANARALFAPDADAKSSADQVEAESFHSEDFGAYELLKPLGSGGMGSVYLARHRKLGKQVAIKILPVRPLQRELFTARFQREIRAAGGLNHAAIVCATDAGEHQGTHFLVMEHIDGLDLSRVARLTGQLPIADACEVVRQVALGLAHAHSQGIVHRDIKPSNLMLSCTGEAKILDFGLARIGPWESVSTELTTVGQLMGTLDYMAPEQAERAEAVDYRADLYSLGATLFRLLCGRAPLAASPDLSPLAKLRLLASHSPPRLDTLRNDAPPELVQFVSSLLARDPSERPASADHVAEQLQEFCVGNDLVLLSKLAQEKQKSTPLEEVENGSLLLLPPVAEAQSGVENGRNIPSVWIASVLAMILAIFGSVFITLETQKGTLVIESEAEAKVKILEDGKLHRELEVVPGRNKTRVYAGQYEVVLSTPSDTVQFLANEIQVRRGASSVATLRLTPEPANGKVTDNQVRGVQAAANKVPFASPALANKDLGDEPVYDGKPVSEFLRTIAIERSPTKLSEAFQAVEALITPETRQTISESLVRILPQCDGTIEVRQGRRTASMDSAAFRLLHRANPGEAYTKMLINELEKGDVAWSKRVMENGFSRLEEVDTLSEWLYQKVWLDGKENELYELVSEKFYIWSLYNEPASKRAELREKLIHHADLPPEFWLNRIGHREDTKDGFDLLTVAKPYCIDALQDDSTEPRLLAQALVILDVLQSNDKLNEQDRAEIANAT